MLDFQENTQVIGLRNTDKSLETGGGLTGGPGAPETIFDGCQIKQIGAKPKMQKLFLCLTASYNRSSVT